MKKTISQCMIVKNEEANIRQALSWGKELMCEQIVVDTGSSDRTVEIAKEMGAKVFHFSWINDFAAAKNYAIEQAKGDWIAFLDADESFLPEDVRKLPEILDHLPEGIEGLATAMVHLDDKNCIVSGGNQMRFFVNSPFIRYEGKIHEHLVRTDGKVLNYAEALQDLTIIHTGYQRKAEISQSKFERNDQMLQEILSKDPENGEYWGYLGDNYLTEGKFHEAEKAYTRALELISRADSIEGQRSAFTYINLLVVYQALGKGEDEIEGLYREAVSRMPEESDFDCVMGAWYWDKKDYLHTIQYFDKTIEKVERYGNLNKAMKTMACLGWIYECLGESYRKIGDYQEAVHNCMVVLNVDRRDVRALMTLLRCFQAQNVGAQDTFQFLGKLYNYSDIKDKVMLRRMAMEVKWKELEKLYKGIFLPQERAQFEAAMETAQSGAPLS